MLHARSILSIEDVNEIHKLKGETKVERAKYTGKCRDKNGYAVHLFYEYRGHEYMITDEHNGYSEPMWVKHKYEQDRIDRLIEDDAKRKQEAPVKYEETCEYGFEVFWNYVNQ